MKPFLFMGFISAMMWLAVKAGDAPKWAEHLAVTLGFFLGGLIWNVNELHRVVRERLPPRDRGEL
jgi:hypothetical protein